MATCISVITRALRFLGVLGEGEAPSANGAADALESLQGLYYDLIDKGADLTDVRITANYTAEENERVFNVGGPFVVTLPDYITDTSLTPDDDGLQRRPPREFAVISIAGDPRETHVYDPTLGDWVAIEDLETTDEAPWASQLNQGLSAMLAVILAPEYGVEPRPVVAALAEDARNRVTGRMQQAAGSVFFQPDMRRWECI